MGSFLEQQAPTGSGYEYARAEIVQGFTRPLALRPLPLPLLLRLIVLTLCSMVLVAASVVVIILVISGVSVYSNPLLGGSALALLSFVIMRLWRVKLRQDRQRLQLQDAPALHALVHNIAAMLGLEAPVHIALDQGDGVRVRAIDDISWLGNGRTELLVGKPLLARVNVRQLAGLCARTLVLTQAPLRWSGWLWLVTIDRLLQQVVDVTLVRAPKATDKPYIKGLLHVGRVIDYLSVLPVRMLLWVHRGLSQRAMQPILAYCNDYARRVMGDRDFQALQASVIKGNMPIKMAEAEEEGICCLLGRADELVVKRQVFADSHTPDPAPKLDFDFSIRAWVGLERYILPVTTSDSLSKQQDFVELGNKLRDAQVEFNRIVARFKVLQEQARAVRVDHAMERLVTASWSGRNEALGLDRLERELAKCCGELTYYENLYAHWLAAGDVGPVPPRLIRHAQAMYTLRPLLADLYDQAAILRGLLQQVELPHNGLADGAGQAIKALEAYDSQLLEWGINGVEYDENPAVLTTAGQDAKTVAVSVLENIERRLARYSEDHREWCADMKNSLYERNAKLM